MKIYCYKICLVIIVLHFSCTEEELFQKRNVSYIDFVVPRYDVLSISNKKIFSNGDTLKINFNLSNPSDSCFYIQCSLWEVLKLYDKRGAHFNNIHQGPKGYDGIFNLIFFYKDTAYKNSDPSHKNNFSMYRWPYYGPSDTGDVYFQLFLKLYPNKTVHMQLDIIDTLNINSLKMGDTKADIHLLILSQINMSLVQSKYKISADDISIIEDSLRIIIENTWENPFIFRQDRALTNIPLPQKYKGRSMTFYHRFKELYICQKISF